MANMTSSQYRQQNTRNTLPSRALPAPQYRRTTQLTRHTHTITGPAGLAEQIGPEHGCSLSPLVQRLVPFLTLSTLDVGYKEAACVSFPRKNAD